MITRANGGRHAPSATAEMPSRAGDYQLVCKLGAGGMGDVYVGVSPTADLVAVKLIKPDLVSDRVRRRFADEVEHLRTVFGARVARFEGADLDAEPAWLATAYIPGLTLKEYVDRHQPLPAEQAAMVGAMLAEGLSKVHDAGLLHRDLKPHNVIMGRDGPVLIDFGISVLRERDSGLTEPGQLVGTPAFMAPEQARGYDRLTERIDVYGLAATLVYALTGRTLYPDVGGWPLVMRITDPTRPPGLEGVPEGLAPLLATMLAHEPADRPDLRSAREALLRIASGGIAEPARRRGQLIRLRQRIAADTFDPSAAVAVSDDLTDPVRDPEAPATQPEPELELAQELEPAQEPEPAKKLEPAQELEPAQKQEPVRGPGAPKPREPQPRADVTWLVERLRRQYARRATL